MNIFATSVCPVESAQWLDDIRANKMYLESAQLLSTHIHEELPNLYDSTLFYKPTHKNHPCRLWISSSPIHLEWLLTHAYHLSLRLKSNHKCHRIFDNFNNLKIQESTHIEPSEFVNCTPYKELPTIEAYRKTMCDKWKTDKIKLSWNQKFSIRPDWYTND